MNTLDSITIRTVPDKPKRSAGGDDLMLAAFWLFIFAWPAIVVMLAIPATPGVIGLFHYYLYGALLLFCGPLPIIPIGMVITGLTLSCRRH